MVKLLASICAFLLIPGKVAEPTDIRVHPVYMSVTEIEYNSTANTIEINNKLFVDDFEQTLRKAFNERIDLLNPPDKARMEKLVNQYIQAHFKISVNGSPVKLNFLGYERIEEGIYIYFEAVDVKQPVQLDIFNNLLYEYKSEQMGIMHCKIKGKIKSTKLNNPESKVSLRF